MKINPRGPGQRGHGKGWASKRALHAQGTSHTKEPTAVHSEKRHEVQVIMHVSFSHRTWGMDDTCDVPTANIYSSPMRIHSTGGCCMHLHEGASVMAMTKHATLMVAYIVRKHMDTYRLGIRYTGYSVQ